MKHFKKGAILLCGLPGCGKTVTGRLLAEALCIPFNDLDETVMRIAGRSIADIFAEDSEPGFRKLEANALRDLLETDTSMVIALGGGTLKSEKARALINKNPTSIVWLKVSANDAARRLETGGLVDDHPLLQGLRGEILSGKLQGLLDSRETNYSICEFSVDTDGLTAEQVAAQIIEVLLLRTQN